MAGSTNFLQHNPTAANQENDATYLADNTRTSGIGVDQIMPSEWMNKIWYQTSTFVAAFAQMMANKGYNMSDANISTLTNVLANVLTSADTKAAIQTVPYAGTISCNAAASNGFQITLTGNATINVVGATPGQLITFVFLQDGTGNRQVTVNGMLSPQTAPPLNPAASSCSVVTMYVGAGGHLVNFAQEVIFVPYVKQGQGIGQLSNQIYVGWSGTRLKATVDVTDLGNVVFDTQLTPVSTTATNASNSIAAFIAEFVASLAGNGYVKIPVSGGHTLIIQWGNVAMPGSDGSSNPTAVAFPIAFPNACLRAFANTFGGTDRISWVISTTASGMTVSNNGSGVSCNWIAIGW